jgi:predicted nucleic acid-binding protein
LPGEPYQENSVRLKENHVLGDVKLCAPAFLVLEVANSLWRAVKLKRLSKNDAAEALSALNDMKIDFQTIDWAQSAEVLEIAYKLNLAIYDGCYVLLAQKLKTQLITADNKLWEAAKGDVGVLHIKDYF